MWSEKFAEHFEKGKWLSEVNGKRLKNSTSRIPEITPEKIDYT